MSKNDVNVVVIVVVVGGGVVSGVIRMNGADETELVCIKIFV